MSAGATATANLDRAAVFVADAAAAELPPEVVDAAKRCLVDWFAVSLAALDDPGARVVRRHMQAWATTGQAMNLYGDTGAPAPMALVNGTLAHSLDFDDLHLGSTFHAGAPTLAAALAVGMHRGCSELEILRAFVIGYELGTTLGGSDIGLRLGGVGWHPTGVLGHFSAAASAAVLLKLDARRAAHALGLAATQCAGLQASAGSLAKPFHVGKAAMNGVMAAEMAMSGMDAAATVFDDSRSGIFACLLQDAAVPTLDSLGHAWQILDNAFKPYAACQLTHAAFEVARAMSDRLEVERLVRVCVRVNPLAAKVAGRRVATTPLEGKFCLPYCVALGLKGYTCGVADFTEARLHDRELAALSRMVEVVPDEGIERWSARLELIHSDGSVRGETLETVTGGPGRTLGWPELEDKFLAACGDLLGPSAKPLLRHLREFDRPGRLEQVTNVLRQMKEGRQESGRD